MCLRDDAKNAHDVAILVDAYYVSAPPMWALNPPIWLPNPAPSIWPPPPANPPPPPRQGVIVPLIVPLSVVLITFFRSGALVTALVYPTIKQDRTRVTATSR